MKLAATLALVLFVGLPAFAAQPRLYIAPATDGFQVSLMAAMQKKHVPVELSANQKGAEYVLKCSPIEVKTQTTGSKFARCLFADCIGIADRASVAVQLVNTNSKDIVWAYTVHKQRGGAMNDQSMAEAIAKHLKKFMKKNPLAVDATVAAAREVE